jgi:NAD(P)H-dependent flavin oxidoreductase YrpB (nitropropane dioxygenase family)
VFDEDEHEGKFSVNLIEEERVAHDRMITEEGGFQYIMNGDLDSFDVDDTALPTNATKTIVSSNSGDSQNQIKAWRDVWSAGHGVGMVTAIQPVADIISQLESEYKLAGMRFDELQRSVTYV